MLDSAAIWQCYRHKQDNSSVLLVLIIILGLLGFAIMEGAILLKSERNDEDEDDGGNDDTAEPELPPSLPDYSGIPECLKDYTPSPVDTRPKVLC